MASPRSTACPGWTALRVRSRARVDLVDITGTVEATLPAQAEGALALFTPHTTAALLVNEGEPGLLQDLVAWLERVAPREAAYAHNRVDRNADAHLRAVLLGPSLLVPVAGGRLHLGTWQRLFLAELDGPRSREVLVRLL